MEYADFDNLVRRWCEEKGEFPQDDMIEGMARYLYSIGEDSPTDDFMWDVFYDTCIVDDLRA